MSRLLFSVVATHNVIIANNKNTALNNKKGAWPELIN